MNYYDDKDHEQISNTISNIKKGKWVLTYDNVEFIKSLYSKYRSRTFELNYSANKTKLGNEIMFYSDNIKYIPKF